MSESYLKIETISKLYPVKGTGGFLGKPGGRKYVRAVNEVSLSLQKGEVLGLIGESGCGKSTLGRLLARLEKPTSGEAYIEGRALGDIISTDMRKFYRTVQIVFQNPYDTFTPRDTIEQIMVRPLKNHKIGAGYAERRQMCLEALEAGGLRPGDDILRRYPHQLSGGQLQRISILRSMLLGPQVIVADEPVSMLDVSVRADIINMLLELSSKHSATLLFISHDIALTRNISDNIAVMYLGKIVEYGEADDVVQNPAHPYTKALISNCASIDPGELSERIRITGEPPVPIDPGPGCFFADRCFMASSRCHAEYPQEVSIGGKHKASCWNL